MKLAEKINSKNIYLATCLIWVSAFILFVLSFPAYHAARSIPAGSVYSGQAAWFNPWDINVYVAAIKWSQENGFNFQNAFTTETHKPIIIYPLYTLLGVAFSKFNPYMIFSVSTIFFGVLLLLALFRLSFLFLKDKQDILTAVFLTTLGGGLGWIIYPKLPSPDIITSPFTFVSTLQQPHESLAVSFYFLSLVSFYLGIKRRNFSMNFVSLIFTILFIPFYPYHLISFFIITGYFALIFALRRNARYPILYFLVIFSTTFPLGTFYSLYLFSGSSFEAVLKPYISTPNLFKVILGYGILFPILIYQLVQRNKDDSHIFLTLWFFLSLLASYLPLPFSRYFLRGLFFPAVLLSLKGLDTISKRYHLSKNLLLTLLLAVVPLSSFYIAYKRIEYVEKGITQWYFLKEEEKAALNYLDKNTQSGSGVLASYKLGNLIPAHTGSRVYFGHYFQTPNAADKIERLSEFYGNKLSEDKAKNFLQTNNIDYVLWEPDEERIILKNLSVKELKYEFLETVYTNSKVTIFSYSE